MGRPSKYNKAIHTAICNDLELGCSRTTAAELNGIDRSTLEEWRKRYPAFSSDVALAMAKAKRRATVTIIRSIQDGDVASAWRYLAMQERDEWRENNDVTVTHGGTITHAHRDMSAFTDDEITALAAVAERVKERA